MTPQTAIPCPTMVRRPKGKKIKTSLFVDEDRMAKLWAVSERTMISTSMLIRHGIDLVLKEYGQKKRFEPQRAEGPG